MNAEQEKGHNVTHEATGSAYSKVDPATREPNRWDHLIPLTFSDEKRAKATESAKKVEECILTSNHFATIRELRLTYVFTSILRKRRNDRYSAHEDGLAVDIQFIGLSRAYSVTWFKTQARNVIEELKMDQFIIEKRDFGTVFHFGFAKDGSEPRGQALVELNNQYSANSYVDLDDATEKQFNTLIV